MKKCIVSLAVSFVMGLNFVLPVWAAEPEEVVQDPVMEEEVTMDTEEEKADEKVDEEEVLNQDSKDEEGVVLTEEPKEKTTDEGKNSDVVAQIGDKSYASFDEAFKESKEGDTIVVLKDCTTDAGINLNKNVVIQGQNSPTITFTTYGMALWGKSITFNNCNLVMNGITSTPYTAEWSWMSICGQAGSQLILNGSNMTLDGQNKNAHAIYADSGMHLVLNQSNLKISNYVQDALEWNGGSFDYNVELNNSSYVSDHNRSGFVGTFNVKASSSTIDVINSRGNGSNGSNFYLTDSVVNFNGNGAHGLSATVIDATNSKINANNNGAHGIYVRKCNLNGTQVVSNQNKYDGLSMRGNMEAMASSITCIGNGYYKKSDAYPGVRIKGGAAHLDGSCVLNVQDTANNGVRLQKGSLTIDEGADVTIVNNHSAEGGNGAGAGLRLESSTAVLPAGVKLYNNHASKAGDDIYLTEDSKITFGKVDPAWILSDCNHEIDGWYKDEAGKRYSVHESPIHCIEFTDFEDSGLATVEGPLALKAAHTLIPVHPKKGSGMAKVAENLDENFVSEIHLSASEGYGSQVVDVIGYGKDNHDNDYNFNFVDDLDSISVKYDGQVLSKEKVKPVDENITSSYVFGEDEEFRLDYYEKGLDGNGDECFVWTLNAEAKKAVLTYSVRLDNPVLEDGIYGEYDADGSKNLDGLKTNKEATLYPINEEKDYLIPLLYNTPTVSYEIKDALPLVPAQKHEPKVPEKQSPVMPVSSKKPTTEKSRVHTATQLMVRLWSGYAAIAVAGMGIIHYLKKKDS